MQRAQTRREHALPVQLLDLVLIQLSNWRWSWRRMVITGMIAPLCSLLALGLFARDAGPEALVYVLTGNVVLALMFENLGKVSSNFAFMKAMGTLNYFATLPIRRYLLVLATLIAFFLMSLPALLLTVTAGWRLLGISLALHGLLLLVVPLTALPLAALGALLGLHARTPEEAGSTTTLLIFVLTALGPVVIPPERLPGWLVSLGWLSPATYAASALRQTLVGPVTARLGVDLVVLSVLTGVFGWLASRHMARRLA